jgi:hypothetical protein
MYSVEWIVDAEDAAVARRCADDEEVLRLVRDSLVEQDVDVSVITIGPTLRTPLPDAVAIDGTLLHPDDAQDELDRLIAAHEAP